VKLILNGKYQTIGVRPEPRETAEWWRWILSFGKSNNPLKGANVAQNLPLICLSCTGGGEDTSRELRIREENVEKPILIPIFTSEYSTAEMGKDISDEMLLSQAKDDVIDPKYLELIIEDQSIPNLEQFYVEAGPFAIKLPPDHILDSDTIMPGTYRAMCAGYWMKLKPPQGQDNLIIQFGGTGRNGFHTKVRYSLKMPYQPLVTDSLRAQ
jgi:hypothetical protein